MRTWIPSCSKYLVAFVCMLWYTKNTKSSSNDASNDGTWRCFLLFCNDSIKARLNAHNDYNKLYNFPFWFALTNNQSAIYFILWEYKWSLQVVIDPNNVYKLVEQIGD